MSRKQHFRTLKNVPVGKFFRGAIHPHLHVAGIDYATITFQIVHRKENGEVCILYKSGKISCVEPGQLWGKICRRAPRSWPEFVIDNPEVLDEVEYKQPYSNYSPAYLGYDM